MLQKINSLFDNLFLKLTMLAALALLATYPAPYFNPDPFWFFSITGLVYPFALLLNLGFALYWLLKKPQYSLLPLGVIACGYPLLRKNIAFNWFESSAALPQKTYKVMTYNVKNFDLYNWSKDAQTRDNMLELLRQENPDIVCFQEFYTKDQVGNFQNEKYLVNELEYQYFHFVKTYSRPNRGDWGIAIFSKYPISNTDQIKFDNSISNTVAIADLNVDGQRLRIFSVHLQSIHLGETDLAYVEDITDKETENTTGGQHLKSLSSIVKKLRRAYIKRGKQARTLAEYVRQSPYPVIVCGDFNDTPSSYAYNTIAENLNDAFLCNGLGIGSTYNSLLPFLRIDYIFLDTTLSVHRYHTVNKNYSDHYPAVAEFSFPETTNSLGYWSGGQSNSPKNEK